MKKFKNFSLIFLFTVSTLFVNAQIVQWVEHFGGSDFDDISNNVVVEKDFIYVTGSFTSPTLNFPTTAGTITLTNSGVPGSSDMFVAKFDMAGVCQWATNPFPTSSCNNYGMDVAVDPEGFVWVIGSFEGGNLKFGTGPPLLNSGGSDFYIAQFDMEDGDILWAESNSTGSGSGNDYGEAITIDRTLWEVYIIGSFESTTLGFNAFPPITLNNTSAFSSGSDVFIARISNIWTDPCFIWAENPDGAGDDYGTDIDFCTPTPTAISSCYVTGYFNSNQLKFGANILTNSVSTGTSDIFVAAYLPAVGAYTWARNPNGDDDDYSRSIAVDETTGDVFITGDFKSNILNFGGTSSPLSNPTSPGFPTSNYFIAKYYDYNSGLGNAEWANTANANIDPDNNFDDLGKSIVTDNCGNAYVTGWYNSYKINFGFPTTTKTNTMPNNYSEIFIAKYNTNGDIQWIYEGKEVFNDHGTGIAIQDGECDRPIITGWYESKLNLAGTFVGHSGPEETKDFYLAHICYYWQPWVWSDPIILHTGEYIPYIGEVDTNWTITSSDGEIATTCIWHDMGWSYGPPFTGTQWISIDSIPTAPLGTYTFERTFHIGSSCIDPELCICVLVDDTAGIYLNDNYIGGAYSMNTPSVINATGFGVFNPGLNTLKVIVNNTIPSQMAFNLEGYLCCFEHCVISGMITDEVFLFAIEGANISVTNGLNTYNAISLADGTYIIEGIEPGTYDITASAINYFSETIYDVLLEIGQTEIIDFELHPEPGIISGYVTDSYTALPIEGALISLEGMDYEAITSSDGFYEITDVEVGTYAVSVSALNYFGETVNDVIIISNVTIVQDFSLFPAPHFEFEGGDPSSPVWTIYLGGGTFEGVDLVPDDEIAIFDGELMVGVFVLDQILTMYNVFNNDLIVFSVLTSQPGYQPGNTYSFKCWDASEEIEVEYFNIELFNPYGDAYTGNVFPVGDGQYSIVEIDFVTTITQTYSLQYGYQFISTRVIPENQDILSICNEILDNLDFVRNSAGSMLRKIGPMWINGIGNWITTEGYLFRMNAADELFITGYVIDPTTPIPLVTGYQFVSYLPGGSIDASVALATIIGDNLDFVRNTTGQILRKIGPNWVNGIGDMNPCEGYLVKMFAEDTLIYPDSKTKFTGISNTESVYFKFEGGNAADPVFTIYIEGLEIGDEIAAFNGDNIIGAMKVNSQNAFDNDLSVFNTINSGEGYTSGQPIILKVLDASTQTLIPFEYIMTDPYNEAYMKQVYPSEDGLYSVIKITKSVNNIENVKEAISIFPNPSEGIINITIEGVSGKVQIKVFDIYGNNCRFFEIEGTRNMTTQQLDLKKLAAGVYFINFNGKNFNQVKKIVIQ